MKLPRKIAIYGSYNGTSIGDTAILLGLLSSIERLFGGEIDVNVLVMKAVGIERECRQLDIGLKVHEIVITEFAEPETFSASVTRLGQRILNRFIAPKIIKRPTLEAALKGVDHLLIGGGNLIMDLYPEAPDRLKEICDCAVRQKVAFSFIGVGAGPIDSEAGRRTLYACMKAADNVYCRDKDSLALVQKLGIKNAAEIPDLALGLSVPETLLKDDRNRDRTVLFNVASVYGPGWPYQDDSKYDDYIGNMVNVASRIASSGKFDRLVLFYSNYPLDTAGGKAFMQSLQKKKLSIDVEEIDRPLSVAEIIRLASRAKLAVVTRLHAGIMVHHGGTPVAAVCYQPKVKSVLEAYDISNVVFDMDFKELPMKADAVLEASDAETKPFRSRSDVTKKIDEKVEAALHPSGKRAS